jgi:hypothetical protein
MSLKISLKENLYCPVLVCDYCGQEITNEDEGMYMYKVTEEGEPDTGDLYTAHKRDCSRQIEEADGGRLYWHWNELRNLTMHLAVNSGHKNRITKHDLSNDKCHMTWEVPGL